MAKIMYMANRPTTRFTASTKRTYDLITLGISLPFPWDPRKPSPRRSTFAEPDPGFNRPRRLDGRVSAGYRPASRKPIQTPIPVSCLPSRPDMEAAVDRVEAARPPFVGCANNDGQEMRTPPGHRNQASSSCEALKRPVQPNLYGGPAFFMTSLYSLKIFTTLALLGLSAAISSQNLTASASTVFHSS